jgi:hypothetical protein
LFSLTCLTRKKRNAFKVSEMSSNWMTKTQVRKQIELLMFIFIL